MSVEDARDDSSSSSDSDETFDDWVEDPTPCKSLFDDLELPSVEQAIQHDREQHKFDLNAFSQKLKLDFHQRVRLVNYIRINKTPPQNALNFSSEESFLSDDTYLHPALPDDPLLLEVSDDWSDDEVETKPSHGKNASSSAPQDEVERLRAELKSATAQLSQLQSRIHDILDDPSESVPKATARDDDSHYFESYGYQEIHATMLRDTVRTMSYAKFILSNPHTLRDKLVMDVGCGTGILSMFAARAGAKHVFAVDASNVVLKARQNIKDNDLEDVITVIQGKVETIKLPAPYDDPSIKIDVIISEWMGYALLYESMLDSVLVARDRFLLPPTSDNGTGGGVMAPSQCKMVLSLAETMEVWKDRVSFWEDVYGYKMSSMAEEAFDDALIEHLPPSSVVSDLCTIKDLPIQRITTSELEFSAPFTLTANKDGATIHALQLYFDTYFQPDGSDVPLSSDAAVTIWDPEGNFVPGDIMQVGNGRSKDGKEKEKEKAPVPVSFSTGPQSMCTHWKQTVFLLKKPFKAIEGTVVKGEFHLRKSETNSRELDVEIHYAVSHTGLGPVSATTVQKYKVR